MALGDWTQKKTGTMTVSLEIVSPIVGNGSLKLASQASAASGMNMYLTSLAHGFTKGRMRTLIKMVTIPNADNVGFGFTFLQSALDLSTTGTPGSSYFLSWGRVGAGGGGGNLVWNITKRTSGLAAATAGTSLYTGVLAASANDYYPIQIEWVADVSALGGTRITFSRGTLNSTDFNTLGVISDLIDSSSPLTTSVAEGIAFANSVAGTGIAVLDETTIYQLT